MAKSKPMVGVVVGSESDLETMERCFEHLEKFGIPHEVRVISAHRTPEAAHEYAATADQRGLKVIIAAAGMSAALGGVLAANTTLPIVGVPIDSGPLKGVDAALSTMQMPAGIPVACMSIGKHGAANAAIFAAEILALSDTDLAGRLVEFKREQADKVRRSDEKIRGES